MVDDNEFDDFLKAINFSKKLSDDEFKKLEQIIWDNLGNIKEKEQELLYYAEQFYHRKEFDKCLYFFNCAFFNIGGYINQFYLDMYDSALLKIINEFEFKEKHGFGYDIENPIKVFMPSGENDYLTRLVSTEGFIVKFFRNQSCRSQNGNMPIDEYDMYILTSNLEKIKYKLYIDMYSVEKSTETPENFIFLSDWNGKINLNKTLIVSE